MIRVKVTTSHPELSGLLLRQTPAAKGVWKHCEFHVNSSVDCCDWWFICHDSALQEDQHAICDPEQIVFISMEASDHRPLRFYSQFAHVVGCDPQLKHRSIRQANGITWWAGIQVDFRNGHHFSPVVNHDYDSLSAMAAPVDKRDRISIITSNHQFLPGHHRRLAFIERLMNSSLASRIDFYGGGHNPIPDKLDALLPYKYHIALENNQIPSYWTEKIADPLLGYCLPFYHGCANIGDYFPKGSYVPIDIDSDTTIAMLERAVEENLYSQHLEMITAARQLVLNDYNLFEIMASIATQPASKLRHLTIRHPGRFKHPLMQRVGSKLRRALAIK
jgi:hypothetical protein